MVRLEPADRPKRNGSKTVKLRIELPASFEQLSKKFRLPPETLAQLLCENFVAKNQTQPIIIAMRRLHSLAEDFPQWWAEQTAKHGLKA